MITFRDQEAFLQVVRPPTGYILDYCFGTSFSLDLLSLFALSQSVAKYSDSGIKEDPVLENSKALQGLIEFSEKSLILFQACQINAPEKNEVALKAKAYRRLIGLLDQIVAPVSSSKLNCSFHPKVWLIKFCAPESSAESIFRLFVGSRNLSTSTDLEIGFVMEGTKGKKPDHVSKKLRLFIETNFTAIPKIKKTIYSKILDDLRFVSFKETYGTKSVDFLFKDKTKREGPWINSNDYKKLIMVSPFLNTNVVKGFIKNIAEKKELYIITTPHEIFRLRETNEVHESSFAFAPEEDNIDGVSFSMSLHAKMYVGLRKDENGTDVFIGSANFTSNGLTGPNTEAMVLLRMPRRTFGEFLKDFIYCDTKQRTPHEWLRPYSDFTRNEMETAEQEDLLEKVFSSERSKIATGAFTLDIGKDFKVAKLTFENRQNLKRGKGVKVQISPFDCSNWKTIQACERPQGATFKSEKGFYSDFINILLTYNGRQLEFMTQASSNLNKRKRNRTIVRSFIKTPDALLKYLMLILKISDISKPAARGTGEEKFRKKNNRSSILNEINFLERVLISASHNESVINQIEEAISGFDETDKQISGLIKVWRVFQSAHLELKKDGSI
jgi:hypothetical protein